MNTIGTVTNEKQGLSWRDWQERNHLQDLHRVALRAKLTKYASIVVLLLAVVFWSYAADYQAVLGFVVCAGAVRVAFLAAAVRRYDWASLFIGMALLYNPVFPLFALTGRVAFFLVIASITAFAASLFLLKPRLTPSVSGC
ncbi:MAG TPA: DUF6804 family protein [Bryobacteraceae bacterium]|nr:DUF6804 family protein [Bryobacteraceae bacterium]